MFLSGIICRIRQALPVREGVEWYVVGGAVRDFLSGVSPCDFDLVVRGNGVDADWMISCGFKMVDPKSTIMVFTKEIPTVGKVEVAFPRRERLVSAGHRGFEFFYDPLMDIEEDLRRRDFTINSMAIDLKTGSLIDPFGGKEDLARGRLRHTSDHFVEDPLRVFRMYRFASVGFVPVTETVDLCRKVKVCVPAERVWNELEKAMKARSPSRFFESWVQTGTGLDFFHGLRESLNIPAGKGRHMSESVFDHSLQTLKLAENETGDAKLRLASFLHDWGKLNTPREMWPAHHNHDVEGPNAVGQTLRALKAPKIFVDTAMAVSRWHMVYRRADELRESTLVKVITSNLRFHLATLMVTQWDGGISEVAKARLAWGYEIASAPARALIPEWKLKEKTGLKAREAVLNSKVMFLKTLLGQSKKFRREG